ncbi:MAG: metallophosphoesterase family protein [Gemmatimonas sp.]|uniref:metallophosphoesterase family protein n=1 Tax=Gemmatimonas sp. TaxID=1962908 RepID=UPI00391FB179|nr:metallophosphoesterase [Gemmatimonadota bacterium]
MADAPSATGGGGPPVRVLHLSDIHCGRPFVAAHVEAALDLAGASPWSAIVVSGDVSQRARDVEFLAARDILDRFRAIAPTLVVPGNHDAAWWHAPFGFGEYARVHAKYRHYIAPDLEPTVEAPGVTLVGLNSAWGTRPEALTWYPRDWRVKGGLTAAQLEGAHRRLVAAAAGDLRILVVHHNVVRGRLSSRWGLKAPHRALDAIAAMPVDVVCTGHDHEERAELVERATGRFVVSAANTLSDRMRGHRPSALNVIEATADSISVTAWSYDAAVAAFRPGPITVTVPRVTAGAPALP